MALIVVQFGNKYGLIKLKQSTKNMYDLLIPLENKFGSIANAPDDDQVDNSTVHILQRLMK